MTTTPVTEHVTFDRVTKTIHTDAPVTITSDGHRLFIDYTDENGTTSVAVDLEFLR